MTAPKGDHIGILQFANDVMLYFSATKKNATLINMVLEEFASQSGQQMNKDKSNIRFYKGAQGNLRREIQHSLQLNLHSAIGYLGACLEENHKRRREVKTSLSKIGN